MSGGRAALLLALCLGLAACGEALVDFPGTEGEPGEARDLGVPPGDFAIQRAVVDLSPKD